MSKRVDGRRVGPWRAVAGAALGLGLLAGCAAEPAPTAPSVTPAAPSTSRGDAPVDRIPGLSHVVLRCGQPFQRPPGPQLVLSGSFPASVAAGEPSLTGRVTVSAGRAGVTGVVAPLAEVFLVRDNRIVTLPPQQDSIGLQLRLGPGGSHDLTAPAPLSACDGSLPDQALPKGRYDVFTRVVVNRDDGARVESFGGPWPLEVR